MKDLLKIVAYGLGGLALALALSLGAIAIAGRSLGEPPAPLHVPSTDLGHLTTPGATHTPKPSGSDDHGGASPSASPPDDHGEQSPSASPSDEGGIESSGGSGTDDHGGDD